MSSPHSASLGSRAEGGSDRSPRFGDQVEATPAPSAISLITIAAATHRGSVRSSNQDAGGVAGWLVSDGGVVATLGPIAPPITVVVADGAGGHPAGDVASRLAVEHILGADQQPDTADELAVLLGSTHATLHQRMQSDPSTMGMATTVAVVSLTPRSVLIAHVGDARVYELASDGVTLLTSDDRSGAGGSVLTQALGGPALEPRPTPHLSRLASEPGLRFLLCSDGVDACLDQAALGRLVRAHADDAGVVNAVIRGVLAAGAPDNVTVIVVRVGVGGDER